MASTPHSHTAHSHAAHSHSAPFLSPEKNLSDPSVTSSEHHHLPPVEPLPDNAKGCSWTYGYRVVPAPDSLRLTVLLREILRPFGESTGSGVVVTDFPCCESDVHYIHLLREALARAGPSAPAVRIVMLTCTEELSLRRQAELAQGARNEASVATMFPMHRAEYEGWKRYYTPHHAAALWNRWVGLRNSLQTACPRVFDFTAIASTAAINSVTLVQMVHAEIDRQRMGDLPPEMVAEMARIPKPDALLKNARGVRDSLMSLLWCTF